MTKPPSGGPASAPSTSEYGATTISGTPRSADAEARIAEHPGSPRRGADPDAAQPRESASPDGGRRKFRRRVGRNRESSTDLVAEAHDPPGSRSGRSTDATSATRTGATPQAGQAGARSRGPRRARLQIRHIDPVTVLKFSCVLAIALFFVWLIVIGVLYGVMDASGVLDHVNETVTTINGAGSKAPITAGIVFGGAAIVGVVNIVLFIALTTIGAVIYNLCADLVGGIEITLSER